MKLNTVVPNPKGSFKSACPVFTDEEMVGDPHMSTAKVKRKFTVARICGGEYLSPVGCWKDNVLLSTWDASAGDFLESLGKLYGVGGFLADSRCAWTGKYSFATVSMRLIMLKETGIICGFLVGNHSQMLCSCHSNWSREDQLVVIRKSTKLGIWSLVFPRWVSSLLWDWASYCLGFCYN